MGVAVTARWMMCLWRPIAYWNDKESNRRRNELSSMQHFVGKTASMIKWQSFVWYLGHSVQLDVNTESTANLIIIGLKLGLLTFEYDENYGAAQNNLRATLEMNGTISILLELVAL